MTYKLTIESDDPTKIQMLVLLADVLLKGQESYLLIEMIEPAIEDFGDMLAKFVTSTGAFVDDAKPLSNMSFIMDDVAQRMRARARLLEDANANE